MSENILQETKKLLGLGADYTPFDQDVISHINNALYTLTQLGIGPKGGMLVTDQSKWEDFCKDPVLYAGIQSYVYIRVKLLFDPPANSFLVNSLKEQKNELEWRLSETREEDEVYGQRT